MYVTNFIFLYICRNEGIINIIITVPKPIFWKSVETGMLVSVNIE